MCFVDGFMQDEVRCIFSMEVWIYHMPVWLHYVDDALVLQMLGDYDFDV